MENKLQKQAEFVSLGQTTFTRHIACYLTPLLTYSLLCIFILL